MSGLIPAVYQTREKIHVKYTTSRLFCFYHSERLAIARRTDHHSSWIDPMRKLWKPFTRRGFRKTRDWAQNVDSLKSAQRRTPVRQRKRYTANYYDVAFFFCIFLLIARRFRIYQLRAHRCLFKRRFEKNHHTSYIYDSAVVIVTPVPHTRRFAEGAEGFNHHKRFQTLLHNESFLHGSVRNPRSLEQANLQRYYRERGYPFAGDYGGERGLGRPILKISYQ